MIRNGMIIDRFNGVDELLSQLNKRPTNAIFEGHLSSHDGDYSFTRTHSYEESVEIMGSGYKDGLSKLTNGTGRVQVKTSAPRHLPHNSVVGFAPHVPNAIAGIPQSMISTTRVPMKTKVVTIVYDGGAHGGVSTDRMITAGKHILSVIIKLETLGYRVSLEVMDATCKSGQKAFLFVKLKDHRQPINPLKTAYPLVHPSYLRRQMFRWLETQPEITEKGYRSGYGMTLHDNLGGTAEDVRKWLKEKGIIGEEAFYTNFYEAEKYDCDELIKIMGLSK